MMGLLCLVCFIVASFVLVLLVVRDLGYPLCWNFLMILSVICSLFVWLLVVLSILSSSPFNMPFIVLGGWAEVGGR